MRHSGQVKMFFKCIGTKSTTFTDDLGKCFESIRSFETVFDFKYLDCKNIWLDYCVTSSAESAFGPVSLDFYAFLYNYFYLYLGCALLEWKGAFIGNKCDGTTLPEPIFSGPG